MTLTCNRGFFYAVLFILTFVKIYDCSHVATLKVQKTLRVKRVLSRLLLRSLRGELSHLSSRCPKLIDFYFG